MSLPATADNLLFSCLSPRDLINWGFTSSSAYLAVRAYEQRACSLEKVLSRYFTVPELHAFRRIQAETGLVISGSAALQFFERTVWDNSDLDLYVDHRYAAMVASFLVKIGYTFVPRGEQRESLSAALAHVSANINRPIPSWMDYGDGRGFAGLFDMRRGEDVKVQLITARYSPLDVILSFHSTCVMQLITHSHAYSLYPRATFEERLSLLCFTNGSLKQDIARQKYVDRGWTLVDGRGTIVDYPPYRHATDATQLVEDAMREIGTMDPRRMSCFHEKTTRRLGDKYCWTIPLPPLPPSPNPAEDSLLPLFETYLNLRIIECNSWVLFNDVNYTEGPKEASHVYCIGESTSCRYKYCLAPLESLIEAIHAKRIRPRRSRFTFPELAEWKDGALPKISATYTLRSELRFSRFIQNFLRAPPLDSPLTNPGLETRIQNLSM